MKTIRVIDLLNKIANKEEVPNKIEYATYTYFNVGEKENSTYQNENGYLWYEINESCLNDEIKILDDDYLEDTPKEDKKIKRIQSCGDNLYSEYIGEWLVHKENYSEYDELLMNKLNEIIDRLNGE